jgi:hypothetical protein
MWRFQMGAHSTGRRQFLEDGLGVDPVPVNGIRLLSQRALGDAAHCGQQRIGSGWVGKDTFTGKIGGVHGYS